MDSSPSPLVEMNHRKRRRNRMRVSCLNCYASKRKCDRKRPCTRCIKHGLTGLCVYELDDPTARDAEQDEMTHLRNRIAELESVIREVNNRPHPRWFSPGGVTHDPSLVAVRRVPKRRNLSHRMRMPRYKGDHGSPNPSVDDFFDSVARPDSELSPRVKEEQDAYTPEFTSSDAGTSRALSDFDSPLTPLSSLPSMSPPMGLGLSGVDQAITPSNSTSSPSLSDESLRFQRTYTFRDGPTHKSPPAGFGEHPSPKASPAPNVPVLLSPAGSESSEEGAPLALLYPTDKPEEEGPDPSYADQDIRETMPNQLGLSLYGEEPHRDRPSIAVQTSPPLSPVFCCAPALPCPCFRDPSVYTALVYFATALRTSREALETLHIFEGGENDIGRQDCEFYRRVVELDDHIFSLPPPTPRPSSFGPGGPEGIDREEIEEKPVAIPEDVVSPSVSRPTSESIQPTVAPKLPICELPQIDTHTCPSESVTTFFSHLYDFAEPQAVMLPSEPNKFAPILTPAYFTPTLTYARGTHAHPDSPSHSHSHSYWPTPGPGPGRHPTVHFTTHFPPTPMLAPSSPPARAPASAIRHEHGHQLPFYSSADGETFSSSPCTGAIEIPPQEDMFSRYRGWE